MTTTKEIIKGADQEYHSVCKRLKKVLQIKKELAQEEAELKDKAIELAGGDRLQYGIKIQLITVRGSVDYGKLVKELELDEATLEEYRRPTTQRWDVRSY
jgi:hypothetical protein